MALLPPDGHLYPAVGMHSEGEEVKVILDAEWHYEDLELMAVDDGEDDWSRLYDVKLNGMVRLPMITGILWFQEYSWALIFMDFVYFLQKCLVARIQGNI